MLRLFYLLSLLICINSSLCYNYIEEAERDLNKIGRNVRREKLKRGRRPVGRNSLARQEYDYDRSPVEFDVANFMQPDEESMEDDESSLRPRQKKRSRHAKAFDYDSVIGLNMDENNKKREKNPDYLSMMENPSELNINSPNFKESLGTKHLNYNSLDDIHGEKYGHEKFRNIYKDDLLLDHNVVNRNEKKCGLRNIKFPFFSHNKSEPMKPKKTKKRKLFGLNPKKDKAPDDKMSDETIIHFKMKRSYEERLCPACRKIFIASVEQDDRSMKTPIIHNSRQFYQNNPSEEESLNEDDEQTIKDKDPPYSDETTNRSRRRKRQGERERERQLKELEEVQRKIDNVEIRLPTFAKPTEGKIVQ